MRKAFEIGGFVAAAVLIAFGVVAIVMGVNGRQTVNSSLSHEYIVAGSDMTPSAIKAEAQKAGICVGGQAVADDGHRQARRSTQAPRRRRWRSTCTSTRSRRRVATPTLRWASTRRSPGRRKSQLMVGRRYQQR